MALIAWSTISLIGAAGGVINAILTGNMRPWPQIVRVTTRARIVRPGLGANICFGALAAVAVFWAFEHAVASFGNRYLRSGLLMIVAGMFVGLLAARWVTDETDKRFLRAALHKACVAPAAHPDTVRAVETASPYEVYMIADDLMPRHGS